MKLKVLIFLIVLLFLGVRTIHAIPNFDLNNDGIVTISDITLFISKMYTGATNADFNADTSVNSIDFAMLKQYLLTQPLPSPDPQPASGGSWRLVFHDEFTTSTVNTNQWVTCYPWSRIDGCTKGSTDTSAWYQPSNVIPGTETLRLHLERKDFTNASGQVFNYLSGMITTGRPTWNVNTLPKFTFKYGYVEMRAKLPHGPGIGPSFWLLPWDQNDPGRWPPEIDIEETPGGRSIHNVYMTVHNRGTQGEDVPTGFIYSNPNYDPTNWHTYGLDWEPGGLTWYVDGVAQAIITDPAKIPSEPMYIIANLEMGNSDWLGDASTNNNLPVDFEIDYIRVWSQ